MPAKKAAATKSKSPAKAPVKPPVKTKPVPLYAVPIYGAIKSGDAVAMKKIAAQARKHISDLTAALGDLDKKLNAKK